MKIQHYSRLFTAETEEQYRTRTLQRFQKLVDKRRAKGEHVVFDPDIVNNDMDRWFTQKAKGNRDIKPQLEAYKTHEELNEAMQNFKSKAEIENDLKTGDFEHEGKELVLSFGIYKVFKTKDVKALTLLAQGSNWCVRFPNAAETYLINKRSTFYIVLRGTDRFVAIRETEENKPNVEVWWYTDYELRGGTNHALFPADLIQEDLDAINQILPQLGFTKLTPGEFFTVYPSLQEYLEHIKETSEYKRFFYNQRFYPDLMDMLLQGGKIKGDLELGWMEQVTYLPEGLHVEGSLDLRGCKNLTILPKDLYVKGRMDASDCINLTTISEGLYVGGILALRNCTNVTSLPRDITLKSSLVLSNSGIKSLPNGLTVEGALYLDGTPIESLPQNLYVEYGLDAAKTNITALPEGLEVWHEVLVSDCTKLRYIPKDIKIGGLIAGRCSNLQELPEGFSVSGMLNLQDCINLLSLPEGLYVGENLDIQGCLKLTSLPKKYEIRGNTYGYEELIQRHLDKKLQEHDKAKGAPKTSAQQPSLRLYHGSNSEFQGNLALNAYKILWLTDSREVAERYANTHYRNNAPYIWEVELKPSAKQIDLRDLSNPRVQKLRTEINNVRRLTIGTEIAEEDWAKFADFGLLEACPWIQRQLLSEGYAGAWVRDYMHPAEHSSFALFSMKWVQSQKKVKV